MPDSAAAVDAWSRARAYENYVGRWSRPIARAFVAWLDPSPGCRWLDVGCGTGALTESVLLEAAPAAVTGIDPSPDFVAHAADEVSDPRVTFRLGDATAVPLADDAVDVVVAGLVLNFVPDRAAALREMRRVTRRGGTVAAYVWDYSGELQLMRYFWDAAIGRDPRAVAAHEDRRFAFCRPGPLRDLFVDAGLLGVEVAPIVVPAVFADFDDFDDYWTPFLDASGPAPDYARSLDEDDRAALRESLRQRLPVRPDGTIALTAGAWAVRGCSGA
jgi:SAM-dependent methyltransferase